MKHEDNLLDAAARVFRDRLPSASRFQALLEDGAPGTVAADTHLYAVRGEVNLPYTQRLCRSAESTAPQIGDMPPEPPTMRGRLGAVVVQAVRRALFWYTGQIRAFQGLVAEAAREQATTLQGLDGRQQRQQALLTDVLNRLTEYQRGHEQRANELEHAHGQKLNALTEQIARQERQLHDLREMKEGWRNELEPKLSARLGQLDETIAAIRRDLGTREREVRQQIQQEKAHLLQQEFRLKMLLRETRKDPSADRGDSVARAVAAEMQRAGDDALFIDHARAFRGDRAEIKSRLTVYAPYAREAFAATAAAPALDLGCGRGEWLELLRELGIPARGIDRNHELVQACSEMGLDAGQGDITRILTTIPDESLSIVSAFHLLEHISFPDLLEAIDQTVRILKPGGIAIFETPNPRNIFVSSNNFYLDPTHRHPIPSELLAFVVESRGLCDPKVMPLSPYPDYFRLADSDCPAVQFINDHFYGAQDYGIVGFKA